jgi:hypothetical protein
MGEINQPKNSIDHGVANCHQSIEASQGNPVDELLEKHLKGHKWESLINSFRRRNLCLRQAGTVQMKERVQASKKEKL